MSHPYPGLKSHKNATDMSILKKNQSKYKIILCAWNIALNLYCSFYNDEAVNKINYSWIKKYENNADDNLTKKYILIIILSIILLLLLVMYKISFPK